MASISTSTVCPYCKRCFAGQRSLNIHLSASSSCMAQQLTEFRNSRPRSFRQRPAVLRQSHGTENNDETIAIPTEEDVEQLNWEEEDELPFVLDVNLSSVRNNSNPEVAESPGEGEIKFDTGLETIFLMMSFNNNRGMSKNDMNRFLALIKNPLFNADDVPFSTADQFLKMEKNYKEQVFGTNSTKSSVIRGFSNRKSVTFKHRDVVDCLRLIVHENWAKPHFIKEAEMIFDEEGERLYTGPETGNWWIQSQEELRNETGDASAVVLPLILYSDATTITQNMRDTVWPIYMTLGNIPLEMRKNTGCFQLLGFFPDVSGFKKPRDRQMVFSKCLEVILQPLKQLSNEGFDCGGSHLYPLFYCYVHDYPEGSKVTGTFASCKAEFPCSSCMVKKDKLMAVGHKMKRRTSEDMLRIVNSIKRGDETAKGKSVHPVDCPLWGFRYFQTDYGNVYKGLLVETMHQSDQGVFRRMVDTFRNMLKLRKEGNKLLLLDTRMGRLMETGWIGMLRLPTHKQLWQTGTSLQANEFRSLMQVAPVVLRDVASPGIIRCFISFWKWYKYAARMRWHTDKTLEKMNSAGKSLVDDLRKYMRYKNAKGTDIDWDIVKVHAISHFREDIQRSGTTQHYSAELYENLHQAVVKGPYRGSNRRLDKIPEFLIKMQERIYLLRLISDFIVRKPTEIRETNFNEADSSGSNVLCSTFDTEYIHFLVTKGADYWKKFPNALKIFLADENVAELPAKINVFKSCAIGRSSDEEGAPETWTAYAHDEHHEKPKYSCVSLVGSRNGEEQIWYARIQSFVTFSAQIASGEIKEFKTAFVQYFQYTSSKDTDTETKCLKLKWESEGSRWRLADINTILRIVHVVPMFKGVNDSSDGVGQNFLLNKYVWK